MQSIAQGVYALPIAFREQDRHINPVAVETERGLILVDTGFPNQLDDLEVQLGEAGFGFDDVDTVLLTHQDSDHAAAVSDLRARSDATVIAHADDAPYIDGTRDPIKGGDDRYQPAPVDVEVVDGVGFRTEAGTMRVVATPGHTPGHISLYVPDEKLLIAADALTAEGEFGGPNEEFTPEMAEAIDSVGRLAELDVERTVCYHGGVVEHDADRIEAIYESLR